MIEDSLINDDPVNELNKKETSQNANGKSNQKKLKKSKESKELKNQNQNAPDRPTITNDLMVIHVGIYHISKGAEPKAVVNGIVDLCEGIQ